jgi:hypothetical protein
VSSDDDLPRAFKRHLEARRGCVAVVAGSLLLVVLAPIVGLVRSWQAWRRGQSWRIATDIADRPTAAGTARVVAEADIPIGAAHGFPARLTELLVRVAEHLRRPDDVYHLVYRIPTEPAAVVLPVGPQLQELGERLVLALGQADLAHRTALWLTLPSSGVISDLVDPADYDPETAGEPEGLVERAAARWAMTTEWSSTGPSLVYRITLWVSADDAQAVERILARLAD